MGTGEWESVPFFIYCLSTLSPQHKFSGDSRGLPPESLDGDVGCRLCQGWKRVTEGSIPRTDNFRQTVCLQTPNGPSSSLGSPRPPTLHLSPLNNPNYKTNRWSSPFPLYFMTTKRERGRDGENYWKGSGEGMIKYRLRKWQVIHLPQQK